MRFIVLVIFQLSLTYQALAQDSANDVAGRPQQAAKLTHEFAEALRIEFPNTPPTRLRLVDRSLMNWTNPVSGSLYGSVYLWTTEHGRPAAVASVIKWYSPRDRLEAELHSITQQPISGWIDDKRAWYSLDNGIKFSTLEGSSAPVMSKPLRLQQMRRLADEFTASRFDEDGQQRPLRLVPQPIYRYPRSVSNVIDGAVFVLAQGTNPDVILILEARDAPSSRTWEFALARMNGKRLEVRRNDAIVWTAYALEWKQLIDPARPYVVVRRQLPIAQD